MQKSLLTSGRQEKGVRFDPRTKFVALIVVASIMLSIGSEGVIGIVRIGLSFIPFTLLLVSGKAKAAIVYIAAYIAASAIAYVAATHLDGPLLFLALGTTGVIRQFLPGFMMGYWFVSTTTVSEFMTACDRVRLSQAIEIPLVVMMRYFPTIALNYSQITDAARMKGIGVSRGLLTAVEGRLIPLLASAVRGGEDLSAAALTRGLGAPIQRTNICKIGFHAYDIVLLVTCMTSIGIVLIINWV